MTNKTVTSGSLRNRLTLSLIGGAALLAILLFFVLQNYATRIAQQGQDNILNASASAILNAATNRGGEVEIDIPYAAFSMLNTASDDKIFYAIFQNGKFLSGYEDLETLTSQTALQPLLETTRYRNETVRLIRQSRTLVGDPTPTEIQIILAQTQDSLAETLSEISRNALAFGVGFFSLAAALSFWASSATIGQLKKLSDSVTRRGPQDLSPFEKPVPAEMSPLVGSLNSLMARLDQSLRQSEDFIAEAAHRLRTPLATVRSYAEATLQRVEKEENRKAMRSMVKAIDESSRAAGQLLDHAMITFRADNLIRQEIDLVELVEEQVLRLTPIADMKDIALVRTGAQQLLYQGDPILIQNAVRNLIDNALKYAPPETSVEIDIRSENQPTITVSDHGEGFPNSELGILTTRFARGQNAEGTVGSGLGLTIAQEVALAHGGDLFLANRPTGGGACVTFAL